MTHTKEQILEVFGYFIEGGHVVEIEQSRGGLINQTYFVTHEREDGKHRKYVMQCINRAVFPNLPELMENVIRVSEHMQERCRASADPDAKRGYLHFIRTRDHHNGVDSETLGFWRLYRYVENSVGRFEASTLFEAYSAGAAFGRFQSLLADMPPPRLHETISRFHDTRNRYAVLEEAAKQDAVGRLQFCRDVLEGLRGLQAAALAVQEAAEATRMPERVVHNDAKLSNVLLDASDGHAVCVIDLDTCMPGLSLHDFGDLMRSICTNTAEDTDKPEQTAVRLDMFKALADGFLSGAGDVLNAEERALMPDSGIALTTEVAVRFLTDYLRGDVYFNIRYPEHNLVRARAQLALAQRMVEALPKMRALVAAPSLKLV